MVEVSRFGHRVELFGVQLPGINKHMKNIPDSGELVEDSAISILETTAADAKNYQTRYYNLDVITAVGYRVNSFQATEFRFTLPLAPLEAPDGR